MRSGGGARRGGERGGNKGATGCGLLARAVGCWLGLLARAVGCGLGLVCLYIVVLILQQKDMPILHLGTGTF